MYPGLLPESTLFGDSRYTGLATKSGARGYPNKQEIKLEKIGYSSRDLYKGTMRKGSRPP